MIAQEAFERARRVADAVLYEGYVLYPYRASAAKNQLRWQFGVLAPRSSSEADSSEHWFAQTECIVEFGLAARLDVKVRGLQVQARAVEAAAGDGYERVASLEVDGTLWATWDEAVEDEIDVVGFDLAVPGERELRFALPAGRDVELLGAAGRVVRERWAVEGIVRVVAEHSPGPYPLTKVRVRVENVTDWCEPGASRYELVRRSFVGVHALLHVDDGSFVSMVDPPEFARAAVAACTNVHTWPVLVGAADDRSTVLSSPIILSEHPEVAAESPGDMFDATEIDEILALRVLTLTDEEKREARGTDARAAAIIDRVDDFPPEVFERLHGSVRSLRSVPDQPEALPWWEPAVDAAVNPWEDTVRIGAIDVGKGSKVRLRPGEIAGRRTDAQDLFLVGRTATVEGVFHDVDGDQHVAVVLDDDPAADLHQWHGRFLYFHPDEVEPIP